MAFEFLHEVDRHGPKHPEVNPTERSVLRCLANDLFYYPHREVNLSHEHIADYVGMAADSVGPTLRKMARKGIEVRVPIGVDKNDKDLFAVPGKTPRFRLPDYAQPEHCDVCRKRKGVQASPLDGHKGGQVSDLGGTGVRPRGDRCPPLSVPVLTVLLRRTMTLAATRSDARRQNCFSERTDSGETKRCDGCASRTMTTPRGTSRHACGKTAGKIWSTRSNGRTQRISRHQFHLPSTGPHWTIRGQPQTKFDVGQWSSSHRRKRRDSMHRRDRYGEPIDDDAQDVQPTGPRDHGDLLHVLCHDGWLDRDAVPAQPCPRCRPWLRERRPPRPEELQEARHRAHGTG